MRNKRADDEKAVMEAAAQFYAALNAMFAGNLGPMKEVWSHADDVTYMGPGGGFQVGWNQVFANWQAQADMKLGGEVKPEGMQITVGQDLAVTLNYEKGENTDAEGKPQKVSIRATNLFRKEDGKWKMIGHHTDLLPYLEADKELTEDSVQRQLSIMSSLINSIPDLIFYKDPKGVYLGCNEAFAELVGRSINEIVGKTDFDLFPEEIAKFFREKDREMFTDLQKKSNEEWVDYPDGRHVLLDTLKAPFYNEHGELIGLLGISRDITGRSRGVR